MRVSEMIYMLEQFKKNHGDLKVVKKTGIKEFKLASVMGITAIDKDGNYDSRFPDYIEVF